jgi:hypothetical protein
MEQRIDQQTEKKTQGQVAKYVRWGVSILGTAAVLLMFVMMFYRKFGG